MEMCVWMQSTSISSAFLGLGCRPSCATEDEESSQGRAQLWTRSGQDRTGPQEGGDGNGWIRGVLAAGQVNRGREYASQGSL